MAEDNEKLFGDSRVNSFVQRLINIGVDDYSPVETESQFLCMVKRLKLVCGKIQNVRTAFEQWLNTVQTLFVFQYKKPKAQSGILLPLAYSVSSAAMNESGTLAICLPSLLLPPISIVYFLSTMRSPAFVYSTLC